MNVNAVRDFSSGVDIDLTVDMTVDTAMRRVQGAIRSLDPLHHADERVDEAVSLLVRALMMLEDARDGDGG